VTSPLLNQPAPDFTAVAHTGQQVRLADCVEAHVRALMEPNE
jgi:peroxiredoxin